MIWLGFRFGCMGDGLGFRFGCMGDLIGLGWVLV